MTSLAPRRTKIVATIGPASSEANVIDALVRAGMDVARLNCSHGTQAERERIVGEIREAANRANRSVALLLDLQGPKIRTGPLENGMPVELVAGQFLTITTRPVAGTSALISTNYESLPKDVVPGERILLADGAIALEVEKIEEDSIVTQVITGSRLAERQGINLPGGALTLPALTPKDISDLKHGLESLGVDYVAMSFVRKPEDVQAAQQRIKAMGYSTPIIAKIEKPQAINQLDRVLSFSDGVMVARGDLGVELPLEQVPVLQKRITKEARSQQIPVIVATQMLESMIEHERPTRAEVSDVANAIFDSVDAVMLSGETAVGLYPVQAVETMARVVSAAEAAERVRIDDVQLIRGDSASLAHAACVLASDVKAKAIVGLTRTGYTGKLLSTLRPATPIIAITPSETVRRELSLFWGVQTMVEPFANQTDTTIQRALDRLIAAKIVGPGDTVIATGGGPFAPRGRTSYIRLIKIPRGRQTL